MNATSQGDNSLVTDPELEAGKSTHVFFKRVLPAITLALVLVVSAILVNIAVRKGVTYGGTSPIPVDVNPVLFKLGLMVAFVAMLVSLASSYLPRGFVQYLLYFAMGGVLTGTG